MFKLLTGQLNVSLLHCTSYSTDSRSYTATDDRTCFRTCTRTDKRTCRTTDHKASYRAAGTAQYAADGTADSGSGSPPRKCFIPTASRDQLDFVKGKFAHTGMIGSHRLSI